MSILLHPRIIASWGTSRWLIGWIIPLVWAVAVYQYVRQLIDLHAGAVVWSALTFAVVGWFTTIYVERLMPPGDLSDGESLVVMLLWTLPIDIACVLVPLLPHLGLVATLALCLAGWVCCGTVTAMSRLGAIALPSAFPSSTTLVLVAMVASVLVGQLGGASALGVALVGVLAVAVVLVVAGLLDGARPILDIDAEIARVGLDAFIHRCRLVDGPCPTPGHPESLRQALYAVPREYGAVKIAHVVNGSVNPETGKYEYRYLKVPASCRTAQEAVAWSYAVPAAEYAPERRT